MRLLDVSSGVGCNTRDKSCLRACMASAYNTYHTCQTLLLPNECTFYRFASARDFELYLNYNARFARNQAISRSKKASSKDVVRCAAISRILDPGFSVSTNNRVESRMTRPDPTSRKINLLIFFVFFVSILLPTLLTRLFAEVRESPGVGAA